MAKFPSTPMSAFRQPILTLFSVPATKGDQIHISLDPWLGEFWTVRRSRCLVPAFQAA
jgi:hypothetical protein